VTRVLVVNLYYPPHHRGGYEGSCRDVAERLAARGHAVAALTSSVRTPGVDDPDGERDGAVAGVPVWRDLTAYVRRDGELWSPSPWQRWRIERANQRALAEAIDRHRPDVVAVWQLGGLSLGLVPAIVRRRIPIVYSLCDDWLSYGLVLDAWQRVTKRLPRWAGNVASAVTRVPCTLPDLGRTGPFLFISEVTRARARLYAPWSMDDTAIVHNGIDTRAFGAPRGERPWGGRLLYSGRYDPRKGIETTIRSLPHLPGETLEVCAVGDPLERARLEGVVAELGLGGRVSFTDVPRSELADRYRAADAVVFPSEWEEPFGLVPLEAMACGTPVVSTGAGGSSLFCVDGVNCVRFTPGDPADLAGAVKRLAGDDELRRALAAGGLRTAAAFDVDRLADAFEAWCDAAATGYASGRPAERDPLVGVLPADPA
jgi:glycosyltransferase involved in cell wall biosynthesis